MIATLIILAAIVWAIWFLWEPSLERRPELYSKYAYCPHHCCCCSAVDESSPAEVQPQVDDEI